METSRGYWPPGSPTRWLRDDALLARYAAYVDAGDGPGNYALDTATFLILDTYTPIIFNTLYSTNSNEYKCTDRCRIHGMDDKDGLTSRRNA